MEITFPHGYDTHCFVLPIIIFVFGNPKGGCLGKNTTLLVIPFIKIQAILPIPLKKKVSKD